VLLAEAVRAAHAGDALISPQVTLRLLRHVTAGPGPGERRGRPAAPLSDRETEVVQAIARGRTNSEIAAGLFISLSTVKSHLTSVHSKLGTRNRVEIAAWAWETGVARATA
jgi:DNA-binding NarL/FixJ family response regulator